MRWVRRRDGQDRSGGRWSKTRAKKLMCWPGSSVKARRGEAVRCAVRHRGLRLVSRVESESTERQDEADDRQTTRGHKRSGRGSKGGKRDSRIPSCDTPLSRSVHIVHRSSSPSPSSCLRPTRERLRGQAPLRLDLRASRPASISAPVSTTSGREKGALSRDDY